MNLFFGYTGMYFLINYRVLAESQLQSILQLEKNLSGKG